jgi:alginate O-acetyltransferase complex protein AlgJ
MLDLSRRTLLAGAAGAFLAAPALAQGQQSLRGRDGWLFFFWDDPVRMDMGPPVARVTSLLKEATQLIEAKNIKVGFAVVPAKSRVYRDMLPPAHPFPAEAEQRYGAILAGLRQFCPLVPDLVAAMAAHRRARPDDQLFFKADTHWTPNGAAVAAAEVARQVQAANILPASRMPGMRLAAPVTETRMRRDLVEFLPASERAAYPPERFSIRKPPAAGGRGGLLDEATSDVAVVGPSFMAPEYNFHVELSAAMNRPVALHWRNQVTGPFQTLLEYLRSPTFQRERPKFLLMSITENAVGINPENRGAYPETNMSGAAFVDGVRQALARF